MMDLINPWGALRRANARIAELEAGTTRIEADVDDLHEECNEYFAGYKDACKDLDAAKALIAKAHFRNPETGRIGPVGETFDA